MAKPKQIIDPEKSDVYGSVRKPTARKGQVFRDRSKYTRKRKHKNKGDE